MTGGPRKVSFILQFTETGSSATAPAAWRAALQEVESGERLAIGDYDALVVGLAKHGVTLPGSLPEEYPCPHCLAAGRVAGGTT